MTRLAGQPHVRVERRSLAEGWPTGGFDLVVLSEIAYYFAPDDLGGLLQAAIRSLGSGGSLVAVHWRGPTDYAQTGDEAHRQIAATPSLDVVAHYEEEKFVLDVWKSIVEPVHARGMNPPQGRERVRSTAR